MEYTQAQVSKLLNCKPQFTLSLCKRGKLVKVGDGRDSRIDIESLEKYINARIAEIDSERNRLMSARVEISKHLLTTAV